jgi:Aminoglycoside-2''-adenylyltransferase
MHTDVPAGFEPVQAVRSLLSSLTVPWWVTGGWATDLAVGQVTRPHDDVDVALLERDEHALRQLPGVGLQLLVGPDRHEQPWTAGRRMLAGPDSIRLVSPRLPVPTEVLFAAAVGTTWVYHRGKPTIVRPLSQAGKSRYGIPYLAPEVVLAMKSMSERDKDEHDFSSALPLLDRDQREWLRDAITRRWHGFRHRAGDPVAGRIDHPWISRLTTD